MPTRVVARRGAAGTAGRRMKVPARTSGQPLHDVKLAVSGPALAVEPECRPVVYLAVRPRQIHAGLEIAVGLFETAVALDHAADHVVRPAVGSSHGLVGSPQMQVAAADAHLRGIVGALLRGVYRLRYRAGGAEPIRAPMVGIEAVELVIEGQCPGRIDWRKWH